MSESRLLIIVACGAGAGIAATFNGPTGVFFGFELILREFPSTPCSPHLVRRDRRCDQPGLFGSAPFFSEIPHDLALANDYNYLLVALLGLGRRAHRGGVQDVLYKIEDICDQPGRAGPSGPAPPSAAWPRGGAVGAPQMYGVGYPVMDKAVGGHDRAMAACHPDAWPRCSPASLTIGIGGSGGVFAPSLFVGAMAGTAFGVIAHHVFGPAVGDPAIYGVVAMGAVFAAAAQAPLTAIASVIEMTGNFSLALPIMLAVGIAAGLSKRLTYGTIYTTKLLRRGTDIERPTPGQSSPPSRWPTPCNPSPYPRGTPLGPPGPGPPRPGRPAPGPHNAADTDGLRPPREAGRAP